MKATTKEHTMKTLITGLWRATGYLAIAYLVVMTIVAIVRIGQFTTAMIKEFRKSSQ